MAYDENLAERIRRALERRADIAEKKMFGGLAFLSGGKMFCGIVKDELMVRVGPGAAAALHGTAHLHLERAPALILTDRYAEDEYRRLSRQRLDQPRLYAPVTKGSFTLTAEDAAATTRRAIELALAGRPGPVHVDLPYDVMLAEAADVAPSHPHPSPLPQGRGNSLTPAARRGRPRRPRSARRRG